MLIEICIGSSCYLKGSQKLVELFQKEIESRKLDAQITLAGCFCKGMCNREGVTLVIDDVPFTGITPEKFDEFFQKNVLENSHS